jgi:hypothetical protein
MQKPEGSKVMTAKGGIKPTLIALETASLIVLNPYLVPCFFPIKYPIDYAVLHFQHSFWARGTN